MVKYFSATLLLLVTSLVMAQGQQPINSDAILQNVIQTYESGSNAQMSYDAKYAIKTFDGIDTYKYSYQAHFFNNNDSVFNAFFNILVKDNQHHSVRLYNGRSIYVLPDTVDKKLMSFDVANGELSPINGRFDGNIVSFHKFLTTKHLRNVLVIDSTKQLIDTLVDNQPYWIHRSKLPDDDDYTGMYRDIYINKSTSLIDRLFSHARYFEQVELQTIYYSNVSFKPMTEDVFLKSGWFTILKDTNYVEEKFQKPKRENLPLGSPLISISGLKYPAQDSLTIDQKNNKITVLDFWYTSCMPCIKAIPILNKIYKKYSGKIEMYGINMLPQDIEQTQRIDDFVKRTPIAYPIVLVDWEKYFKPLKLHSFPTIMIYDQSGNMVLLEFGFKDEETLYNKIDGIINQLM